MFVSCMMAQLAVMNILGVPVGKVPDYASDLNFSLFENSNNYYVKVNFNNKPVLLSKCNNSNRCTLDQFDNL